MRKVQRVLLMLAIGLWAGTARGDDSGLAAVAGAERIAVCLAARNSDCLLDAAAALMSGGIDFSSAYRLAHAQMRSGDRIGVQSTIPYVYRSARFQIVASLAGSYWTDGDTAKAMELVGLLETGPDRARLMAAIGIAQYRSGNAEDGRRTIDLAEDEAMRASSAWNRQRGLTAVIRARAAINDQAAATMLLTRLYRTARNGGADRSRLGPLEQIFIEFGDIAGTREVLLHIESGAGRARHMIELAKTLAGRGDERSADKFLQLAVAIIADEEAYGERFPAGRVVHLQSVAKLQAEMGRPDDALLTLDASFRLANRIAGEIDVQSEEASGSFERNIAQSSAVDSLILMAEIGNDGTKYASAIAAAAEAGNAGSQIDLLTRIATSMADNGDRVGARTLFEDAYALARDHARQTNDYNRHVELEGSVEAAGLTRLSAAIREDAISLMRTFADRSRDPQEVEYVADLQSILGDVDGVLATLRWMQDYGLESPDDEFDDELVARSAAYYAARLAQSGYLEGAYEVADFGVNAARSVPRPVRRASVLVELALSPTHQSFDLPGGLPIEDILSPLYPPI